MKSKILHGSYIIGFVESNYPREEIDNALLPEINKYLDKTGNANQLTDWTLQFLINYNNVEHLLIARKTKSFPKEKYKEIVIHIPIPNNDMVSWGVKEEQLVNMNHNYKNNKYIDMYNINPTDYNDRATYIIDTMKFSIKEIFKLGVTVNGKRIVDKTLSIKT